MSIYGGFQLPRIDEESLDDKKERRQILNYLALLDEKLRYMFQNIEVDNMTEEFRDNYLVQGQAFQNFVKDTDGNFSLLEQTADKIAASVADAEGNIATLSATADNITTSVSALDGRVTTVQATADGLYSTVYGWTEDGVAHSGLTQRADAIELTVNGGKDAQGKDVEGLTTAVSSIRADLNGITLSYDNKNGMASIAIGEITVPIYDRDGTEMAAAETVGIEMQGYVSFSALEYGEEDEDGNEKTIINGDFITTGKILADYIKLGGKMKVYEIDEESGYKSVGGYIGYGVGDDPLNGSTAGVIMTDYHEDNCFIAHGSGCTMQYNDEYSVNVQQSGISFVGDLDFNLATNFICYDSGASLGTNAYPWDALFADSCSCCTSDRNKKNSIEYDMGKYEDLFAKLKPTQFKMNNGRSGRYHVGFISQDVEDAMAETGLDSLEFAGFIKSPAYEKDEKGREIEGGEIIGYDYGLRYEEFVALNTHMIQKLMARVEELERKLEGGTA